MRKKLLVRRFGLPTFVWITLLIGTVSAAIIVISLRWGGDVAEPIQVTLIKDLPPELYPGCTYEYVFDVKNVGDAKLKIEINVTHSPRLEVEVDLDEFDIEPGETVRVTVEVFVPTDAEPGDAWLNVEVMRD